MWRSEWVSHSQVTCGDRSVWERLLSKSKYKKKKKQQTPYIAGFKVKARSIPPRADPQSSARRPRRPRRKQLSVDQGRTAHVQSR